MPVDFGGALELAKVLAQRLNGLLWMANHRNAKKQDECTAAFKRQYHDAQHLLSYGAEANLAKAVEQINPLADAATFSNFSADSMHAAVLRAARYYLKHQDNDAATCELTMLGTPKVTPHELDRIHLQLEKERSRIADEDKEATSAATAQVVNSADGLQTAKPRKRRRRLNRQPRPLTAKQTEAIQVVGECKGNLADAARRLRVDRATLKEHYQAALKKLGKTVVQHQTQFLASNRRGQADVAYEDDRRRG